MTKTILILAIAIAGLGTPSAFAGQVTNSCDNVEHWNKIAFHMLDTITDDTLPPLLVSQIYELIFQVDPDVVIDPLQLVGDRLVELGYTLPNDIRVTAFITDVEYSSFCNDLGLVQTIGGMLLQPDAATLVIAYGIANAIWLVPSVAGIGIAVYLTRNRLQKH